MAGDPALGTGLGAGAERIEAGDACALYVLEISSNQRHTVHFGGGGEETVDDRCTVWDIETTPLLGDTLINRQDAVGEDCDQLVEPFFEHLGSPHVPAPLALDSSAYLTNRQDTEKELLGGHSLKPCGNARMTARPLGQLRCHVGIDQEVQRSTSRP